MANVKYPVFIHADMWVLPVCPVAPAYTIDEAGQILGNRARWVESKLDKGMFKGPASTDSHPIDHEALAAYVRERDRKLQRDLIRKQLVDLFTRRMTDLGDPPPRSRCR